MPLSLTSRSKLEGVGEVPALGAEANALLDRLATSFSVEDALEVKKIERTTNHDVKAIEYVLKDRFKADPQLSKVGPGARARGALGGAARGPGPWRTGRDCWGGGGAPLRAGPLGGCRWAGALPHTVLQLRAQHGLYSLIIHPSKKHNIKC